MELLTFFLFLAIGLSSLIISFRDLSGLRSTFLLLLTISVVLLNGTMLEPSDLGSGLTYTLTAFLALNFIVSRIEKIRNFKINWLVPVGLALMLLFFRGVQFSYNEFEFTLIGVVMSLIFKGILIRPIIGFKLNGLKKFLSLENDYQLNIGLSLFVFGLSSFLGIFFASHYGVMLVAVGMIGTSFYQDSIGKNVGLGLLLVSLMPVLATAGHVEQVDLNFGKIIEGLFFGAFSVVIVHLSTRSSKRIMTTTISLILVMCLLLGLLWLGTQKADLGGVDAFIAALIGIAFALQFIPEFALAEPFVALIIAGGLLLAPLTVNKEAESLSVLSVNVKTNDGNANADKEEIQSPFEMNGIALDSIIGNYSINEKTAQITFQLGPKGGITKGAFKTFSGKVKIAQKVENSIFQVELPVGQLTTFNQYRDESLLEKGYFNMAEFPVMTYRSTKLKKETSHYELEGSFTMLGVTKPLNVQLKYIGTAESEGSKMPVLVGRSTIDRTQFGMKPDPKEGNLVDFEFKIELIK